MTRQIVGITFEAKKTCWRCALWWCLAIAFITSSSMTCKEASLTIQRQIVSATFEA